MRNLTRIEAQDRAAALSVTGYDVDLDLREDGPTFRSRSTVRFTAAPGGRTFVEVRPRQLRSVRLNGRTVDAGLGDGRLVLDRLAEVNELVVDADMAYSHDGEGLCRSVDPADGQTYLYAMSFLDAAPRWYACFDQPDLKAPLSLMVRTPRDWTVAGNGPVERTERGQWRLHQRHPLATYMTTLIAGRWATVADEVDGTRFALHARASLGGELERDASSLLRDSADFLAEYRRRFAIEYPWGEYHQAFVPDFNSGAMENPGCVTITEDQLFRGRATQADLDHRANLIAHEMAHMWFGDLVTMRWWDDLWLNESFAEYLGFVVCEALGRSASWTDFGSSAKPWGQAADRRPSSHPVAGNSAADTAGALNAFDGISYAKGAALLRQLAARLGPDAFAAGLRRHLAEHAFGNATLADLLAAWSAESDVDVSAWSDAWLRTSGMDRLAWRGGALLRRSPDGTRREHAVTVASFRRDGTVRDALPVVVVEDETPAPVPPGPLVLPDARDDTWAKIELEDAAWRDMPELLPRLRGPERLVVWSALRLAVADAEVDPRLAVQIAVAALPVEPDDSVLAAAAEWAAGTVAAGYLPDAERAAALAALAAAAEAALSAAAPGSGHALAAARAWIGATGDAAALRDWLAGDLPHGLVLDVDLRWEIVHRLCALGAMSGAELAHEAARDRTAQGERRAARCAAARPDPAAKEQAWRTLMSDPDAANSRLYALAQGFWQPGQQVTDPYVARYFAELPATAALRSGWALSRLAGAAYPRTAVRPETVAATDRLLGRDDLHPGIRRGVTDAGDDLRRAVAARERFG